MASKNTINFQQIAYDQALTKKPRVSYDAAQENGGEGQSPSLTQGISSNASSSGYQSSSAVPTAEDFQPAEKKTLGSKFKDWVNKDRSQSWRESADSLKGLFSPVSQNGMYSTDGAYIPGSKPMDTTKYSGGLNSDMTDYNVGTREAALQTISDIRKKPAILPGLMSGAIDATEDIITSPYALGSGIHAASYASRKGRLSDAQSRLAEIESGTAVPKTYETAEGTVQMSLQAEAAQLKRSIDELTREGSYLNVDSAKGKAESAAEKFQEKKGSVHKAMGMAGEFSDEFRNLMAEQAPAASFISGLAYSGGRMIPDMAIGYGAGKLASGISYLGGLANMGEAATTAEIGSRVQSSGGLILGMFPSVYANSLNEQLNSDAYKNGEIDIAQANGKAAADAAIEVATEAFVGGVPGLNENGIIDKVIEGMSSLTGSTAAGRAAVATAKFLTENKYGKLIYDFFGEGMEEVTSDLLNPMFTRLTVDPDAANATPKELLLSFLGGGLTSLGFQIGNIVSLAVDRGGHISAKGGDGTGAIKSVVLENQDGSVRAEVPVDAPVKSGPVTQADAQLAKQASPEADGRAVMQTLETLTPEQQNVYLATYLVNKISYEGVLSEKEQADLAKLVGSKVGSTGGVAFMPKADPLVYSPSLTMEDVKSYVDSTVKTWADAHNAYLNEGRPEELRGFESLGVITEYDENGRPITTDFIDWLPEAFAEEQVWGNESIAEYRRSDPAHRYAMVAQTFASMPESDNAAFIQEFVSQRDNSRTANAESAAADIEPLRQNLSEYGIDIKWLPTSEMVAEGESVGAGNTVINPETGRPEIRINRDMVQNGSAARVVVSQEIPRAAQLQGKANELHNIVATAAQKMGIDYQSLVDGLPDYYKNLSVEEQNQAADARFFSYLFGEDISILSPQAAAELTSDTTYEDYLADLGEQPLVEAAKKIPEIVEGAAGFTSQVAERFPENSTMRMGLKKMQADAESALNGTLEQKQAEQAERTNGRVEDTEREDRVREIIRNKLNRDQRIITEIGAVNDKMLAELMRDPDFIRSLIQDGSIPSIGNSASSLNDLFFARDDDALSDAFEKAKTPQEARRIKEDNDRRRVNAAALNAWAANPIHEEQRLLREYYTLMTGGELTGWAGDRAAEANRSRNRMRLEDLVGDDQIVLEFPGLSVAYKGKDYPVLMRPQINSRKNGKPRTNIIAECEAGSIKADSAAGRTLAALGFMPKYTHGVTPLGRSFTKTVWVKGSKSGEFDYDLWNVVKAGDSAALDGLKKYDNAVGDVSKNIDDAKSDKGTLNLRLQDGSTKQAAVDMKVVNTKVGPQTVIVWNGNALPAGVSKENMSFNVTQLGFKSNKALGTSRPVYHMPFNDTVWAELGGPDLSVDELISQNKSGVNKALDVFAEANRGHVTIQTQDGTFISDGTIDGTGKVTYPDGEELEPGAIYVAEVGKGNVSRVYDPNNILPLEDVFVPRYETDANPEEKLYGGNDAIEIVYDVDGDAITQTLGLSALEDYNTKESDVFDDILFIIDKRTGENIYSAKDGLNKDLFKARLNEIRKNRRNPVSARDLAKQQIGKTWGAERETDLPSRRETEASMVEQADELFPTIDSKEYKQKRSSRQSYEERQKERLKELGGEYKTYQLVDSEGKPISGRKAEALKNAQGALTKDGRVRVLVANLTDSGEIFVQDGTYGRGAYLYYKGAPVKGTSTKHYQAINNALYDTRMNSSQKPTMLTKNDYNRFAKAVGKVTADLANTQTEQNKKSSKRPDAVKPTEYRLGDVSPETIAAMKSGDMRLIDALYAIAENIEVKRGDNNWVPFKRLSTEITARNDFIGRAVRELGYDGIVNDGGAVVFNTEQLIPAEEKKKRGRKKKVDTSRYGAAESASDVAFGGDSSRAEFDAVGEFVDVPDSPYKSATRRNYREAQNALRGANKRMEIAQAESAKWLVDGKVPPEGTWAYSKYKEAREAYDFAANLLFKAKAVYDTAKTEYDKAFPNGEEEQTNRPSFSVAPESSARAAGFDENIMNAVRRFRESMAKKAQGAPSADTAYNSAMRGDPNVAFGSIIRRSGLGSPMSNAMASEYETAMEEEGTGAYYVRHNVDTIDNARKMRSKYGTLAEAFTDWMSKFNEGTLFKYNEGDAADAAVLGYIIRDELYDAIEQKRAAGEDYSNLLEAHGMLTGNISTLHTMFGQANQVAHLLYKLNPAYGINSVNAVLKKASEWAGKDISSDDGVQKAVDKYRKATTSEATTEALEEIAKAAANVKTKNFVEWQRAWRYFAMLANPATHIANFASNTGNYLFNVKSKAAIGGKLEDIIMPSYNAKRKAKGLDAVERTKTAQAFVRPTDAAGAAYFDSIVNFVDDDVKKSDVMEVLKSQGRKYADAVRGEQAKTLELEAMIRDLYNPFMFEATYRAERWNSNMLEKADEIALTKNYKLALKNYLLANNLTVDALEADPKLMTQARAVATEEAQKATYRNFNSVAKAISTLESNLRKSENGVARVAGEALNTILPFKNVPMNVAARGIFDYSPIGLIDGAIKIASAARAVENGVEGKHSMTDAIDQFAAGVPGTAATLLGYLLGRLGLLRGKSDDSKEGKYDQSLGGQDYAIKLPNGTTITIERFLPPSSMALFMGVEFASYLEKKNQSGEAITDFDAGLNGLVDVLTRVTDPLIEMSFMQGVQNVLQNLGYGGLAALPGTVTGNYIGQFVPTLAGRLENVFDPTVGSTQVDTSTALPGLQRSLRRAANKIPGVASMVNAPAVDYWGEDKRNEAALLSSVLPTYISTDKTTYADERIQEIFKATGDSGVLPSAPAKNITIDKKTYRFDNREYHDRSQTIGKVSKRGVDEAVSSALFNQLSVEDQAKVVENIYEYAKSVARYDYCYENGLLDKFGSTKELENVQAALATGINLGDYFVIDVMMSGRKKKEEKSLLADSLGLSQTQRDLYL